MGLIEDYGGYDFLDLDALESFAEFCYNKGHEQGIEQAINELFGTSDLYYQGIKEGEKRLATFLANNRKVFEPCKGYLKPDEILKMFNEVEK